MRSNPASSIRKYKLYFYNSYFEVAFMRKIQEKCYENWSTQFAFNKGKQIDETPKKFT